MNPDEWLRALRAIIDGYEMTAETWDGNGYIIVENPNFDPTEMTDPFLVIDMNAISAYLTCKNKD